MGQPTQTQTYPQQGYNGYYGSRPQQGYGNQQYGQNPYGGYQQSYGYQPYMPPSFGIQQQTPMNATTGQEVFQPGGRFYNPNAQQGPFAASPSGWGNPSPYPVGGQTGMPYSPRAMSGGAPGVTDMSSRMGNWGQSMPVDMGVNPSAAWVGGGQFGGITKPAMGSVNAPPPNAQKPAADFGPSYANAGPDYVNYYNSQPASTRAFLAAPGSQNLDQVQFQERLSQAQFAGIPDPWNYALGQR